jgi:L-serine dehydratase
MIPSIFNDVIGPVMRGPSSSHCAAALRIGRLALDLMDGSFEEVLVEFDREGSLPTTHDTQGSDMGLCGGLMGWDAVDPRLPESMRILRESGVRISIETVDAGDPHPNTYRLTLRKPGDVHTLHGISTGGGMIEVIEIDGFPLSIGGDCHVTLLWADGPANEIAAALEAGFEADSITIHERGNRSLLEVKAAEFVDDALVAVLPGVKLVRRLAPVLPVTSGRSTRVPFTSCAEMLSHDAGRGTPLWQLAVDYESARGGIPAAEVVGRMVTIVRILRSSIAEGIAGTSYNDRVLGHQCGRFNEMMRSGSLLDGGALNRIILYVSSLMEVKSSMGVIVAAPTAGACAALPGAVIAMAEAMGLDEEAMARAMLASGLIGIFITTRWTFAAEVGGCQAEGGSAASMAAAALVTLAGGSLAHCVAASSMAMQNMIGLICDPVANRVEVPCLGKNVMAASNALACANMALAGYDPVIPLDEVIDAAALVSTQMPRELRCTNLGGLSITPTAVALESKLAERRAASCGSGCHCG